MILSLAFVLFLRVSTSLSGSNSKLKSCSPWLSSIVTKSRPTSDCRYCYTDCIDRSSGATNAIPISKNESKLDEDEGASLTHSSGAPDFDGPGPIEERKKLKEGERTPKPLENRCQCDKLCVEFGDCCVDSTVLCPRITPTLSVRERGASPTHTEVKRLTTKNYPCM